MTVAPKVVSQGASAASSCSPESASADALAKGSPNKVVASPELRSAVERGNKQHRPPVGRPPSQPATVQAAGLVAADSQVSPSQICVRNTFIHITSSPPTPSSPVVRSCPPTASLPAARPGPLLPALAALKQQQELADQQRRSPVPPAGKPLETPSLSTASPGSKPLEEVWNSPLRPFENTSSALGGPQVPPWNPDLISELVTNAALVLESHTPTLSSASPAARPAEGLEHVLPIVPPPQYTPLCPAAGKHGGLGSVPPPPSAPPGQLGAELDAKAMACSFAAISGFAAIDEGEEENPDSRLEGDSWWRALEDTRRASHSPSPAPSPPPELQQQHLQQQEQLPASFAVPVPPGHRSGKAPSANKVPLPSVGSKGHFRKNCKPCAFLYTKGCANGQDCEFCHLCEAGEKKRRVKEKLERRRRQEVLRKSKVQVQGSDVQPVLPVGEVQGSDMQSVHGSDMQRILPVVEVQQDVSLGSEEPQSA